VATRHDTLIGIAGDTITPISSLRTARRRGASIWRHSPWDALLVGVALVHGLLLVLTPSVWLVALGLWWNANTIAHNFIHRPFFRSQTANRMFSAYSSLVLGVPQSLWRARHLAHHAADAHHEAGRMPLRATAAPSHHRPEPAGAKREIRRESALVAALWIALAVLAPAFLLRVYLPGWSLGLVLCLLQGRFEHARGTTSHYGRIYNLLFFNDGYHVEHHRQPGLHWRDLSHAARLDRQSSRWPPVLRWLEPATAIATALDGLERLVLRSPWLQSRLLALHERAFRHALLDVPCPRHIVVIGGGLFPRSALILRRRFPDATLTVVDADAGHIDCARGRLDGHVRWQTGVYETGTRLHADLVVVPLAFIGDRAGLYVDPPAALVLVHDWWWRPRGTSIPISRLLLKRLNVIRTAHA
jgi:hypothetical protein